MGVFGFIILTLAVPVLLFRRTMVLRKSSSDSIDKLVKQAEVYLKADRPARAWALLRPLEAKNVGGSRLLLISVRAMRQMGKEREAYARLQTGLEAYPNDLLLIKELGKLHLALGQFAEAKEAFLRSLSVLQGEEEFMELASACFQSGAFPQAWKYLTPFLKTSGNGRLFSLAGDCMFLAKNFSCAIPLYRKSIKLGWVNHKLLNRLGHSFRLEHQYKEAEEVFRRLLYEDREDVVAALGLGLCFEMQGFHAKALLLYQQEEVWLKGDERIVKRAGICAYKIRKFQAASCYLGQWLDRQGADLLIMGYLSSALLHQKKFSEAKIIYQKMIDSFPQSYIGYRGLAWLYGVGAEPLNHELGVTSALKALKMKPDRINWEILSACYARSGQYAQAHKIQEALAQKDETKEMRSRRLKAMRMLRKQTPLHQELVAC